MTKREKIILLIALIAIVSGAYYSLSPSPKSVSHTKKDQIESKKFVIDAINKIASSDSLKKDRYIIAKAKTDWVNDPFYESVSSAKYTGKKKPLAASTEDGKIVYSGYLATADKKIAVLNGREYETGEALGKSGYVVMSITTDRVSLGLKGSVAKVIPLTTAGSKLKKTE